MSSLPNKKPLYVSTSIAYVNGAPHVGFAMESIEADVIARWGRYNGRETFFLTGTDEHGEKIQRTAEDKNTTPQALCDENSQKFKELGGLLHISNDDFIRTSDQKKHWPSVHKLWNKLVENGDLEKRSYTANYCYGCEAFMLEKDLDENGNCPNHKRPPEEISEENYFFNLSKYSEKIATLLETNELQIVPEFRKNEILTMAKEGFHDISFSRPSKKLPWGVSIPNDPTQNMYVWCDALTNYIAGLNYAESESENNNLFNRFWGNSESNINNREVVHVIGKDILRFHAGIWIGMLLSAGEKLPNKIFVHGFLTSEGHKMSKSLGNVVDPFEEVKKYGTDALRYFLLREVPIGKDADFSRSRFEEIYQAHLANGLGNLVSRVYNLCERSNVFTPSTKENLCPSVAKFLEEQDAKLVGHMNDYALHDAIAEIFKAIDFCDVKINNIKPWELIATNPKKVETFLTHILYVVLWVAEKLIAFLPETSEKINKIFNISNPESNTFGELDMLFPRLEKLNLPNASSENKNNSSLQAPEKKDIHFKISDRCKTLGIYTENIQLENIAVKKTPRGMQKFLKQEVKAWLEKGGSQNPEWKKRIEEQDAIKIQLGFTPEDFICAPQMLANLAEKNGKLPNINNIVDLYNIISLKYGLSAGAHDTAFLDQNVSIDITKGEQVEVFTPMPGKEYLSVENSPIAKNEYAFFINEDKTKIGCRFDAAQCEESKITEGNKNIFIYFQSVNTSEESKQWAKNAMQEFTELVKKYGLTH